LFEELLLQGARDTFEACDQAVEEVVLGPHGSGLTGPFEREKAF